MKTLGIVGAENSHSWNIANICNKLKKVPLRVTHIWGETAKAAEYAAGIGEIPNRVKDWKELAGKVDAVMIDHRHGALHVEPARYFISRGIPAFIDKPMTCALAEAKGIFALADKKKTPVITFSAKPLQKGFRDFAKKLRRQGMIRAFNTSGPCDLDSKAGGIFFYGIHQVDAVVDIMGFDVEKVSLVRNGENAVASLFYRDGRLATMNFLKDGGGGFHWRACTEKGIFSIGDQSDTLMYLQSAKILANFVNKGVIPFTRQRMLAAVAILEALDRSLKSERVGKVAKF